MINRFNLDETIYKVIGQDANATFTRKILQCSFDIQILIYFLQDYLVQNEYSNADASFSNIAINYTFGEMLAAESF
ncbi:MAG: hypothetical protein ACYCQJ_11900 [Nitrososphaerales archaeon]